MRSERPGSSTVWVCAEGWPPVGAPELHTERGVSPAPGRLYVTRGVQRVGGNKDEIMPQFRKQGSRHPWEGNSA